MKPVKVGICGLGTVGGGTFNVLQRNAAEIARRAGRRIQIEQIGMRRPNPACDTKGMHVTADVFEVATNPEIDIVIELIGGYDVAYKLVMTAIENGKHVVTANKALIAVHGNEIFAAAQEKNVMVAFEASVAGGIPIIKALREGLSANKINWLAGIINGTGNFIMTEMREKGRDFQDVLAEAQALGYAEADPTFDVEGVDAAHKVTIMASIAFGIPVNFEGAYVEGISQLQQKDIAYAEELGYRIKLLAITKAHSDAVEIRVHPTLIPEKRLVANVNGPMNAVLVKGNMVGPTLYYGAGAGAEPTASAVVADVIDIVRQCKHGPGSMIPTLGFTKENIKKKKLLAIEEVESEFYLRLSMKNKTGLLANITNIFADKGVSIDAMVHKEIQDNNLDPDIFLVTSKVKEQTINEIISKIESLPENKDKIIKIRIEELNK